MTFDCAGYPPEVLALIETMCPTCGMFLRVGDWPHCPHESTHGQSALTVVDDSIPGGMTIENLGPVPETFYSKSDWKRRMKELGVINKVEHKPLPGSDKSAHTTRWV